MEVELEECLDNCTAYQENCEDFCEYEHLESIKNCPCNYNCLCKSVFESSLFSSQKLIVEINSYVVGRDSLIQNGTKNNLRSIALILRLL